MMLAPPTIDPVEQRRPRQPGSRRRLSVLWNSVLRLVHGGYAPGSVTLLEKQLGLHGRLGEVSERDRFFCIVHQTQVLVDRLEDRLVHAAHQLGKLGIGGCLKGVLADLVVRYPVAKHKRPQRTQRLRGGLR